MKKKIKLRDLTVEQYKEWHSNNQCEDKNCNECLLNPVLCHTNDKDCWVYCKDLFSNKFLDQKVEVEVPDVLDEVEKEYLSNVIKPFRNKIIYIKKLDLSNKYSIVIDIYSKFTFSEIEHINLPVFQNSMYNGMELNKSYTLGELGL